MTALDEHLRALAGTVAGFGEQADRLREWGLRLAGALGQGARLLAAGNGGSAAEAQHLVAELVGKLDGDRPPLSAIALTAESSSVTAISNDYGYTEVFARQVRAHGRPGDVVILLSSSGRSPNLLSAAETAQELGLATWGLTGPLPNPLADRCAEVVAVPSPYGQVVQELHLVAVHLLCASVDAALPAALGARMLGAA
ncbi:MAG TPA: SIS domain-containing protein [Rugosimonospora sp.]|nr:SIS domain-containing protein [Rugosimonospora sp.]